MLNRAAMRSFGPRTIVVAIAAYFIWGALLIAQKPGLQWDEALLVERAVAMRNAVPSFATAQQNYWICPFGHCVPLMSADYVGSIKDYVSLPLFYLFGPRTSLIRLVSLLLGALGIWGIAKLVDQQSGAAASGAVSLILAINPAYLNMVVFDNNAIAAMMAALGLVCASLAAYLRRRCAAYAFLLGASIGFAFWARANFAWTLLAGGIAVLVVYRRNVVITLSQVGALVAGGIVGGAPFLLFQWISHGATWKAREGLVTGAPWGELIPYRLFLLGDSLLSDGEHRKMWGAVPLAHLATVVLPGTGRRGVPCLRGDGSRKESVGPAFRPSRRCGVSSSLWGSALFATRNFRASFAGRAPVCRDGCRACVFDTSFALRIGAASNRRACGAVLRVGDVLERIVDSWIAEYGRAWGLVRCGDGTGAPSGPALAVQRNTNCGLGIAEQSLRLDRWKAHVNGAFLRSLRGVRWRTSAVGRGHPRRRIIFNHRAWEPALPGDYRGFPACAGEIPACDSSLHFFGARRRDLRADH